MNALALSWTSFICSVYFVFMCICSFDFFNKISLWMGEALQRQMKTSRGKKCQVCLYVHSVEKIAWFFEQQTEFFLISCLAVAKSFSVLSLVQYIKMFFYQKCVDIFLKLFSLTCKQFYYYRIYIYIYINIYIIYCIMYLLYYIYIIRCDLICWVYKKYNYFLYFHYPIFHSKIPKHPGTIFA